MQTSNASTSTAFTGTSTGASSRGANGSGPSLASGNQGATGPRADRPRDWNPWGPLVAAAGLRIQQQMGLAEVLQATVDEVRSLLECDRVLIYRFEPDWGGQVIVESIAAAPWSVLHRVAQDICFNASWVEPYRQGRIYQLDDVAAAALTPCHAEFLASFQVQANLVIPILHGDRLWGLLVAHHCTGPYPWPPEAVEGLQHLAVQVGIAIHQAELVEQLQAAKADLEAQVTARTEALERANQQLSDTAHQYQQVAAEVGQREDFLRRVLDSLFTFVGVMTPEGHLLEANQAPLEMAGLRREDVVGKPFEQTYWWAYSEVAQATIRQAIAQARQGQSVRFDIPVQGRGGQQIMIDFALTPLRDAQGTITHLIPSAIDITDRLQKEADRRAAEQALQESQVQLAEQTAVLNTFYQTSPLMMGVVETTETDILHLSHNPATAEFFGLASEDLAGQWSSDLGVPPEFCQLWLRHYYQSQQQQRPVQFHYQHPTPAAPCWLLVTVMYLGMAESGRPTFSFTVQDISDRKQLEVERQRADTIQQQADQMGSDLQLLENILDRILAGYWDWDIVQQRTHMSPGMKRMFGYADHELPNLDSTWQALLFPEDQQILWQSFDRHVASRGEVPHAVEVRYRHRDGSTVWVLCAGQVIEWDAEGQPLRMVGCHINITDRKQGEVATRQHLAAIEAAVDGIAVLQEDQYLYLNQAHLALFGYDHAEDLQGQSWQKLYSQAELSRFEQEVFPVLERDRAWRGEAVAIRQDGSTFHEGLSLTLTEDGLLICICRDITESKQLEATMALQLAAIEATIDGIGILQDGQYLFVNQAHLSLFGFTQPSDLLGQSWTKLYSTDEVQRFERDIFPLLQQNRRWRGEAIATRQDGTTFPQELSLTLTDSNILICVCRDNTKRIQAAQELKNAKDQLELFIQATSEGFWDWDLITHDIYFSPRWKEMLGYDDHELDNTLAMWESVLFEDDRVAALQLVDDYNSGRLDRFSAVQRFYHKNGGLVYILSRAIHLKDDQGQVIRMIGSHLDVTSTIEVQKALQTSEMQLSSILNSSLDGIMAFQAIRNSQGQILDFEWLLSNPTASALVGQPASDLIGKRLLEEMPGSREDGLFDLYVQVVETGNSMQRQFHYNHEGIDTWFENVAVKLGDGFVVTFRDISALKTSEQALQQANQTLEIHLYDLQQRNTEMLLLSETSDFLQSCRTLEEACAVITTLVQPLFPDCAGGFFITSASRNRLDNVAAWGTNLNSKSDFYPHDCWALRRGRLHQVGHDRLGLRCNHVSHTPHALETLCIPMIAQGETLGLFYLNSEKPEALNEAKKQLARTVAEQVGLAIANLHLRETLQNQSIRDALTGLFNRRYLEEVMLQEIARSQRNQYSIAVIMIDVDHFKRFNDTHGHDAGDYVLQMMGQVIRENIRGSDVACRYGGEELTLVFPETNLAEAVDRAEDLRQAIANLTLDYNGTRLGDLSASFGVAAFPHHGTTGPALIQAADIALYRAKQAGRNRIVAVDLEGQ